MTGLIEHLWQSTLVIGVLFLIGLWMRNAPGRLLNLLWWAALAKLFLPWAVLGAFAGRLIERLSPGVLDGFPLSESAPPGLAAFVAPARLVVEAGEKGTVALGTSPASWVLLWLAGAGCIVLVWTVRGGSRRGRAVPATNVGGALQARLASQLRRAGVPADRVTLLEGREMPKVEGWLRPRILLPLELVRDLDPLELRALLIHEEAHRRRRDPLLSALGRLAVLCFYYYPLLWPLLRRLRTTTEMACDERVLAAGVPRETYTRALARAIGLCLATPTPSSAAAGRSASLLRKRLQRITDPWRFRAMTRHRIALTLGCLAVLAGSFLPGTPVTVSATAGDAVAPPLFDDAQRAELRKLAAWDRTIHVESRDASPREVLQALAREADVTIAFKGRMPEGRREYRLSGLTLEQALLEIARPNGLFYRVTDERTLTALAPLLAGIGGVVNPVLLPEFKVEPEYPEEAKEAEIEGVVILQALILADGTVDDIEVLRFRPEDDPGFVDAARDAVRQWRYEPATLDGLPVPVYFTVFIEFKLK